MGEELASEHQINVLALMAASELSGPFRGLLQLVEHSKDLGVRFVLGMFLVRSFPTSTAIEEAKKRGLHVAILSQLLRYDPLLVVQADKLVRQHRISIIQSHGYKAALLAWCLRCLTGLPWIAFAHGYTSENPTMEFYKKLDLWLLRRADRVVVVSRATGQLLEDAGVHQTRIRVIHNAIDPADHSLNSSGDKFRANCSTKDEDLLVGVIGRFSPEKGQSAFIRAFKRVAEFMPNAKAVLIGEGQELSGLQAAVNAVGLEGHVTFAGYQSEMSSIYAALDLVVIPSFSEGLPNVLLEAMLHKKAVIATAVGGIPEVLQDALSRSLVPPGNEEALAQKMLLVLRDSELRVELGAKGALHVRESFTPALRAEQLVNVYREIVGNHTMRKACTN